MDNNILTIQEIQDHGFIYTSHVAFSFNRHTNAVTDFNDPDAVPKLTYTYLLGEEKEWDIKLYDVAGVKQRAVDQMKKLGIKWVNQVYYGEIYIPKDQYYGTRYHHIFARAAVYVVNDLISIYDHHKMWQSKIMIEWCKEGDEYIIEKLRERLSDRSDTKL